MGVVRRRKPIRQQKAVPTFNGVRTRSMKRQQGNDDNLGTPTAKRQTRHSPLFHNLSFYLTMRNRGDTHNGSADVDKAKMATEIVSRGGRIMDDCCEGEVDTEHSFLLSDECCRTQKYLVALATGIPCVSYDWITECTRKERLVSHNSYLLPSGQSHDTNSSVQWTPRRCGTILHGMLVHIVGKKAFKSFWSPVLLKAGATIATRLTSQEATGHSMSVVIADPEEPERLSESLRNMAARCGFNILSVEWIIQCLVHGYTLPLNHKDGSGVTHIV